MSEQNVKLKDAKKVIKPYDMICYINLVPAVIGAVFLVLGSFINNNDTIDILFSIGIGLFAAAAFAIFTTIIVGRKAFDEYFRLKKEDKNAKK